MPQKSRYCCGCLNSNGLTVKQSMASLQAVLLIKAFKVIVKIMAKAATKAGKVFTLPVQTYT